MYRSLLFSFALICIAVAAPEGLAQGDPTSGDLVLFPGTLEPLTSPAAKSTTGTSSAEAGWHLPGRRFRAGDGWWALVCKQQCSLHATRLQVRSAMHEVAESAPVPSQHLYWAPLPWGLGTVETADRSATLIALIKPVRSLRTLPLKEGPVKTWLHVGAENFPTTAPSDTTEIKINMDAAQTAFLGTRRRPPQRADDIGAVDSVTIELRVANRRQALGDFGFDTGGPTPLTGKDFLRWAGDLDGDGKLDLLVRLGNDMHHYALFLSTQAKPGEIVGLAGRFAYADPATVDD